ncbi:MAG TPA: FadR/GntR family transcriptional regulator, partial [Caldilineaceae bacterium]|nr:FadR/GntR family transcriptional regulator [Caldilineaceae bacterium]
RGTLQPGQRIPGEHELSKQFSASRGSIREALGKLEAIGLVEIKNGSGAYVARWSLDNLNLTENLSWLVERRDMVLKILQGREEMQGLGARLCAERISEQELAALVETWEQMDLAKESGDLEAVTEADTRFHYLIGEYAGNEVLNDLIARIEEAYRSSSRALMDLGGRAQTSVVEHGAIIEAIEAHHGQLAEERMLHHIASVRHDIAALGRAT